MLPDALNSPEALASLARALGLEDADLDEAVQDGKLEEASAINNAGLEAQIAYLCDALGPAAVADLLRALATA